MHAPERLRLPPHAKRQAGPHHCGSVPGDRRKWVLGRIRANPNGARGRGHPIVDSVAGVKAVGNQRQQQVQSLVGQRGGTRLGESLKTFNHEWGRGRWARERLILTDVMTANGRI
jgi:hypothetical protein